LASPGWRGHERQSIIISLFSLGLILGGLVSASAVWILSGLAEAAPGTWRASLLVLILIPALLRDLRMIDFRLPQTTRQIPRTVFTRGLEPGSVQFGFELGTGVRTYIPTTVPYVLAGALLLLAPGYLAAILAGTGFGLGRAAMPVARFWSREAQQWDHMLKSLEYRIVALSALSGAAAAAWLAFSGHIAEG
jgi:hypothetical protein